MRCFFNFTEDNPPAVDGLAYKLGETAIAEWTKNLKQGDNE
jgi:hypothetical protein